MAADNVGVADLLDTVLHKMFAVTMLITLCGNQY